MGLPGEIDNVLDPEPFDPGLGLNVLGNGCQQPVIVLRAFIAG